MMNLFSAAGRACLDELAKPGSLCAFDFDGTLAPLVTQPERAYAPKNIISRLAELSNYAKIAIITGRSVADVSDRLGFHPDYLVGNHGLEGMPGWQENAAEYREMCRQWLDTLRQKLPEHAEIDPNIWMEDKTYSLSIHYRMARDRVGAEQHLLALLPELLPSARIMAGKCVLNLLPPDAGGKGNAMAALLTASQASGALYVGDDVTDEDVFRMQHPELLSVRIGHEPRSSAKFFLAHRLCILQLLDELLVRFRLANSITSRLAG
ncbi:trehalose-phosphatase [Oxalobacteraceae bacterium R-40]|uniref:Trehalose 6-phosphate phosphatase n=1 Tax=Keguizhuia sedimenti TaxID=3064264 RepID=A0ABU1BNC9_9BURK|nr:trehalose-phosphatase [Oxalobacteraceae bacterium R-40]